MIPLLTDVTTDHVKPRCAGGGNGRKNLVASCYECNQYRGLWDVLLNRATDQEAK